MPSIETGGKTNGTEPKQCMVGLSRALTGTTFGSRENGRRFQQFRKKRGFSLIHLCTGDGERVQQSVFNINVNLIPIDRIDQQFSTGSPGKIDSLSTNEPRGNR